MPDEEHTLGKSALKEVDQNTKIDPIKEQGTKQGDVPEMKKDDEMTPTEIKIIVEAVFKTSENNGVNIFSCIKCGKNYKNITGVKNHFNSKHMDSNSEVENSKEKKRYHSTDSEEEMDDKKKCNKGEEDPFHENIL